MWEGDLVLWPALQPQRHSLLLQCRLQPTSLVHPIHHIACAVDETIRLLKAFQFTDAHGEVLAVLHCGML